MKLFFAVRRFAIVLATLLAFASDDPVASAQGMDPPSDLIALGSVPGDHAVSLFWTDNSREETGFEIQRSTGVDSTDFVTIDIVFLNNIGSYNDVGLDEITTYNYRVQAFNNTAESGFSNVATAMTGYSRPLQVSGLQGELFNGLVGLTWIDNADNETRYEVERAEVGVSTEFTTIATLEPNSTSYVDDTGLLGAVYNYRVNPWRFDVEGGVGRELVTIDMGPGGIAPLTSVAARVKMKTSIDLSWKGGSRGTSVQIQRFNPGTGLWGTIAQVDGPKRRFRDTGLTSQTVYFYRLRAVTTTAVSPFLYADATTR